MNALLSSHGNLTYAGLLERLKQATAEELNQTVTVFVPDTDEFYPVADVETTKEADILDEGHLFLKIR
jgi:hypothetical protein